jgi:hypothetical protein
MFSGTRLREARLRSDKRPERVAVAIDRSVASLFLYERGEVDPPASVVAKLAQVLACQPGDYFDDEAVPA